MLAERGVGRSNATEKDELADWVHKHQDLNVVRPEACPAPHQPSSQKRSVAELQRMSVAELRDQLAERGVPEGSATEKSELARWVYEHQDLPALYTAEEGRRRTGSRRGPGGSGESYESPREKEEKQQLLEAEAAKLLEGEAQQLLEGSAEEEAAAPRRLWPWALFGVGAVVTLGLGVVVANDMGCFAEAPAAHGGEGQPPEQRGSAG
ncbi:unnamed protein product [Polarella glacialis]|uniref:SAP domain-containing protein n=1 Tax=Polarella glacialis TaxID=89957 RepID=A0A813FBC2_POLGL|nr:unnamed protein product [Polarella glacialis]